MDYFEKRQWIRIAVCAVLVLLITLGMTGVFSGGQPLLYGSTGEEIRAERENKFSTVTLIATAKDGNLESLRIESSGEKDLLSDDLRREWADAILESGSADPDVITGATLKFSAQSVQEAAEEIFSSLAGK